MTAIKKAWIQSVLTAMFLAGCTTQQCIKMPPPCGLPEEPLVWLKADCVEPDPKDLSVGEWLNQAKADNHFHQTIRNLRPTYPVLGGGIHFDGKQWLTMGKALGADGTPAPYGAIVYMRPTSPFRSTPARTPFNAPGTIIGGQTFNATSALGIAKTQTGLAEPQYSVMNGSKVAPIVRPAFPFNGNHMMTVLDDSGHHNPAETTNIRFMIDASSAPVVTLTLPPELKGGASVRQITSLGAGFDQEAAAAGATGDKLFETAQDGFVGDVYEVLIYSKELGEQVKFDERELNCLLEYFQKRWPQP